MASGTRFPYHRLGYGERSDEEARSYRRIMSFQRFRGFRIKRRRVKVGIPGLKMLLRAKRRLLSRMRVYWGKALKKLKNGEGHMNDLFGGNYLAMQLGPAAPFKGCPKPPNYGYSTGKFMEGPDLPRSLHCRAPCPKLYRV